MSNILQIIDLASPYKGNIIPSLEILEQHWRENGNFIYLFPSNAQQVPWMQNFIDSGEKVYFINRSFFLKKITWQDLNKLNSIVNKENIKIIHTHYMVYNYTLFLYKLLFFKNLKYFAHIHNQYIVPKNKWRKIKILITNLTYNIVIGVSESVADGLISEGIPKKKVKFVLNGIKFERLDTFNKILLTKNENPKVILMFGWPFYIKGVDISISAISDLVSEGKNINLAVVYSGDISELEAKVIELYGSTPNWIKFLEPRDDVASYFNSAAIFLSASRQEGFSCALVEAAYCNPLIVSSNIPAPVSLGIPEIILFESENKEDLKRALNYAIDIRHYTE